MQEHAKASLRQLWHHGANFASSPARVLIDFMDPLIVAEKIATTDRNRIITIRDIKAELHDEGKRIGGSYARGKK